MRFLFGHSKTNGTFCLWIWQVLRYLSVYCICIENTMVINQLVLCCVFEDKKEKQHKESKTKNSCPNFSWKPDLEVQGKILDDVSMDRHALSTEYDRNSETHSMMSYGSDHPADRYSVPLNSSYPLTSTLLWSHWVPGTVSPRQKINKELINMCFELHYNFLQVGVWTFIIRGILLTLFSFWLFQRWYVHLKSRLTRCSVMVFI